MDRFKDGHEGGRAVLLVDVGNLFMGWTIIEVRAHQREDSMAKKEKLLGLLPQHLDPGEHVEVAVAGTYEIKMMGSDTVRSGILVATPRRLVFFAKKLGGFELESYPYENISSFEQSKSMMGGSISFFASGNKVTMKWIQDKDLGAFVELVRGRMGKQPHPAQPPVAATSTPPPVPVESAPMATQQPASSPSADEIVAQIQQLASLRDAGILTEKEFTAKKTELLGRI